MTTSRGFGSKIDHALILEYLNQLASKDNFNEVIKDELFISLLENLRHVDAFSKDLQDNLPEQMPHQAVPILRQLRTAYALTAKRFLGLIAQLTELTELKSANQWRTYSNEVAKMDSGNDLISKLLLHHRDKKQMRHHLDQLIESDPHAIYPTSNYRTSSGSVSSTSDGNHIEAVFSTSTMTEIHIEEGVLEHDNPILRNIYKPLGRCVCVVDSNVSDLFGKEIEAYFQHNDIDLTMLVYRAMEVDKGIQTIQSLLSDFKKHKVSRQEPVLIVGGGVIADTGGLACSLYHRNTPYVMLATSIVSGIDAGPSPRTCCDGFGFKNLFGAYHAPVVTITDRSFFETLRSGWIRHGVAEIIKMAVVKDEELFDLLEEVGIDLVRSHFGTTDGDKELRDKSKKVLCLAMRSYVQSEYPNLYETHQCRPHAYGHTWSPGYEIPSGMLHGHAVSCGMGFGAFLSCRLGWISTDERDRILQLISNFELSLWHDILDNHDILTTAQDKVIEKRGGNLVAPLPKGSIGSCGYLNDFSNEDLIQAISEYKELCKNYPRGGAGVEPHCEDVGLEDPSTVSHMISPNHASQTYL